MDLKKFACKCGNELELNPDGLYYCSNCNTRWEKETVEEMLLRNRNKLIETFGEALAEQKEEHIANVRKKLWNAVHEKYITRSSIRNYADELLTYIPDDFYAMFIKSALSGNKADIVRFLSATDKENADIYLADIVYFICKTADIGEVVKATSKLLSKFGNPQDDETEKLKKELNELANEIKYKVRSVDIARDVFVSYSDNEREYVEALVEKLERKGLKCFVAYRNLPNDTTNFWYNIETAITNTKMVLLVSSPLSRNNDNVLRELGRYFMLSQRISEEKKCCRIEYLLGEYPKDKKDYAPGDTTVYRYFSEEGYTYFTVGQEEELAIYLHDIKVNGYLAVKQEKKQPTEIAPKNPEYKPDEKDITEEIRVLCIMEDYDAALELCKKLIIANSRDMRGHVGLIRVESQNYEAFEGDQIEKLISRAQQISRKTDLSEFDPDFADYAARRKQYFDDKAEAERKAKEEAARKAREEAERRAKEEAERKRREEERLRLQREKEERERKAREIEELRKQREEAERLRLQLEREERERKAREIEELRKQREEAERRRLQREREEAARKVRAEEELRKEREEAERRRQEQEKAERLRLQREQEEERKAKEEARRAELTEGVAVGSIVRFGRYPQSNANTSEPIEWTVLKNENGKIMLLASKILDQHRFDRSINNYAKSEIRKWLNNDFYNKAFSDEEKAKILTTTVDNSSDSTCFDNNPHICADTRDKVFLLSVKEAKTLLNSAEGRKHVPTPYAKKNGAYEFGNGYGYWWLRSPSLNLSDLVRLVYNEGSLDNLINVICTNVGVVPALVIEL